MQDILASRKIKTYRLGLGQFNFFIMKKRLSLIGAIITMASAPAFAETTHVTVDLTDGSKFSYLLSEMRATAASTSSTGLPPKMLISSSRNGDGSSHTVSRLSDGAVSTSAATELS